MSKVVYEIVEHDGGWTYKVGDVLAETFETKEQATLAANDAAARQELEGKAEAIGYQDARGDWHEEMADGDDRPETEVDKNPGA